MPAARYWRIVGLESYSGGDLEFSEIALFNGSTQIQDQATVTSTFAPVSGTLAALNDNSLASTVAWSALALRMPSFEIRWDFGVDVDVTRMEFGRGLLEANGLWQFTCQYSSDGVQWIGYQHARAVPVPFGALSDIGPFDPFYLNTALLYKAKNTHYYYDESFLNRRLFSTNEASAPLLVVNSISSESPHPGYGTKSFYRQTGGQLAVENGVFPGDFTVEAFVKFSTNATAYASSLIFGTYTTSSGVLQRNNSSPAQRLYLDNAANGPNILLTDNPHYQWCHYAVTHTGGVLRGFFNGQLFAEVSKAAPSSANGMVIFESVSCWFTDIRLTHGAARYTASFTPPTRPLGFNLGDPSLRVVTPNSRVAAIDRQWGGTHRITGTVKNLGSPNQPVRRRVQLIHETSGIPIRETWSDAVTGEYTFSEISPQARYTVVAYDHTGVFRAVVADNLTPTP